MRQRPVSNFVVLILPFASRTVMFAASGTFSERVREFGEE